MRNLKTDMKLPTQSAMKQLYKLRNAQFLICASYLVMLPYSSAVVHRVCLFALTVLMSECSLSARCLLNFSFSIFTFLLIDLYQD